MASKDKDRVITYEVGNILINLSKAASVQVDNYQVFDLLVDLAKEINLHKLKGCK